MKTYQVVETIGKANTAATKAVEDIVTISDRMGFQKIYLKNINSKMSISAKIHRQIGFAFGWHKILSQVENDSIILLQHPFRIRQLGREGTVKKLKKKNVKFIALIHDVEKLRVCLYNSEKYYDKEFAFMLEMADVFVVHNARMAKYFTDLGVPSNKIVELGIFDYIQEEAVLSKPTFAKQINIAGNLAVRKSPYIAELGKLKGVNVQLYGPNFDSEMNKYPNIKYGGSFPPDKIPQMLTSGFGLVWDGTSIQSCSGDTGEYLRYNNPHKLSLYLSCGMPVVIWREAAEAQFVIDKKVGIAVNSLKELSNIFKEITEDEYALMADNANKLSGQLRRGAYTQAALKRAIKILT